MHYKRHELKYYISNMATETLLSRLSAVMDYDGFSAGSQGYRVRSLYFDSFDDECLYEKQSGFLDRKKIRLRTYGDDNSQAVKFEIKRKNGQLVRKDSALVSRELGEAVCAGEHSRLLGEGSSILDEIYSIFQNKAYSPKVIVEYIRIALTLPVSNVRITFDTHLASNINHLDLFSDVRSVMPVILEGRQILEIKYDDFLPGYLKKIISGIKAERMAISKYTHARRFSKMNKWEDN